MATDPFRRLVEGLFNRFGVKDGFLDGVEVDVVVAFGTETWDEGLNAVTQYRDTARFKSYEVSATHGRSLVVAGKSYKLGQKMRDDGYVVTVEIIRSGS